MNWLRKSFSQNYQRRFYSQTFILIGRRLMYSDLIHEKFLQEEFDISNPYLTEKLRFLFPRGRALFTEAPQWPDDTQVYVEASEELQKYQGQIARDLEIRMSDRPRWIYKEGHYDVYDADRAAAILNAIIEDEHKTIRLSDFDIVEEFRPDVFEKLNLEPINELV